VWAAGCGAQGVAPRMWWGWAWSRGVARVKGSVRVQGVSV